MPMPSDQQIQKKPEPCSFVIFGATGDLAHRLVIPALYNLAASDLLPDRLCVVGVTRKAVSNEALRDSLMKGLRQFATRPVEDATAKRLLECVTCIAADPGEPASFDRMRKRLDELEATRQTEATACSIWRRRPMPLRRSAVSSAAPACCGTTAARGGGW
jgi:glucose-6-phosphate 1-dehydrogenase